MIAGTGNPRHMRDNLAAGRGCLPDAAMQQRMVHFIASLGQGIAESRRTTVRRVSSYAIAAVVTAVMLTPGSVAYAQDTRLSTPNVTVTAAAVPVEPPSMRDPWKSVGRNPYFGRYRAEADKFAEVPCAVLGDPALLLVQMANACKDIA